MNKFKLALLQTKCIPNKEANIKFIQEALNKAGQGGAKISILGEICNSPYSKNYMIQYAEDFSNSPTLQAIKAECLKYKMYAIGSIPRKSEQKYFNTAFVINPQGNLLTKMDKIHLFDIDIPGKITYKQSDTFTPGNNICVFDTQYCKFGLGICYDLRFAQMALLMGQKGAKVLIYPGSFNQTTGPLHWELLLRGRAIDTQTFTIGVSCAQYKQDPTIYQAWGHSTVVDPFGRVLVGLDQNPNVAFCQIDPDYCDQVRQNIPISKQKRTDIYKLEEL